MELGALNPVPPRRRRIGRWIVLAAVVVAGGVWGARRFGSAIVKRAAPATAAVGRVVPPGVRIRVEVFNATDTRGLARQAMFSLRDAGFDVVYFGNTSERADSTIVRDRSGHADWAALAARAMRGARIESQPDSSRYVDLSVFVGRHWAPPREPLHP